MQKRDFDYVSDVVDAYKASLDLVNKSFTPGEYSTTWNGKDKNGKPVPSGLYLYRYKSSMNIITKKMLLVK